jgi:hypothetical protein
VSRWRCMGEVGNKVWLPAGRLQVSS